MRDPWYIRHFILIAILATLLLFGGAVYAGYEMGRAAERAVVEAQ